MNDKGLNLGKIKDITIDKMGDFSVKRDKKESNDDKKIKSSIDFFEKCGILSAMQKVSQP